MGNFALQTATQLRGTRCRIDSSDLLPLTPARALRRERIAELQEKAKQWAGKLDGQDAGVVAKGRRLSDPGATVRLYHEVCEAHLARIVKVDLTKQSPPASGPRTSLQ